MKILELPVLEDLLASGPSQPFPYSKSFDDAAQDPFCILHTSGTTGVPKPISWSNALIGTMDAVRLLPPTQGDGGLAPWTSLWSQEDTIYSSFPMSHGAGIIMDIIIPRLFDLHCVLGPPDILPNIDLIGNLAGHVHIDIWSMVPSLVDELGQAPDVVQKLSHAKFICASGGPVNPDTAARVNETIRVLNLTGTTEGLFIGNLVVERDDWRWFAFHPYSGFEFREVEPGAYEHWIHRNEHWTLFQGIFHTFPDQTSINLKDLYIKHPSKPNHWAFKGRTDDVVVLSNGYKIQPVSTESFISTHPEINGCLMVGTGKPQAALLIELKNPLQRNNDLFDSIWSYVEQANQQAFQKSRVLRNFIAFTEPDKPLIRTDKGTVKRSASLVLYSEFINRFYDSRNKDSDDATVNTTSVESIQVSLHQIFYDAIPEFHGASADANIFELGFDSLLVYHVVDLVRNATRLGDKLAPRHLYANPTIAKFATFLADTLAEDKADVLYPARHHANDNLLGQMSQAIAQHKMRLPVRMNPFDYVNPNHYMGLTLYFPLRGDITFEEAYLKLARGLRRALELIPALQGKITLSSDQEFGHKEGELCLLLPPIWDFKDLASHPDTPRQLSFKDLSNVLPSFARLREDGFLLSAVKDDLVLPCDPFPVYPADVVVAQANFVDGGCILAANFHHGCLDAVGVMVALRVWAESCRLIDGDSTATCNWLDSESFNHSLPDILYELGDHKRAIDEIDPGTWGFLPFLQPKDKLPIAPIAQPQGHKEERFDKRKLLPAAPVWKYKVTWPPAPDPHGRSLRSTMFLIPAAKVESLKQQVYSDTKPNGQNLSVSDIIQAFVWRAAIRARYYVAKDVHGRHFAPDETAILELPIDGRPYYSALLPSSYMGSMLLVNRPKMPVTELCSNETRLSHIACVLRDAAARVTPQLFNDAFALLRSLPRYDPQGQFSYADMGLDSLHAMISNMILFNPSKISFGDGFFANAGCPESLRPQIERGSKRFRFLVILPARKDGGIEFVLGTLPEELEYLKSDEEVMRYAVLIDN